MNLKKYDNKKVKIIDSFNDEFEGVCTYNNREYNYHEFGVDEDSLQILNIIFYKSDIKKLKEINTYTNGYSKLEELISEEDLIEDILNDDEVDEEHKTRLINYLKSKKNMT